jgi:hypothetical protein
VSANDDGEAMDAVETVLIDRTAPGATVFSTSASLREDVDVDVESRGGSERLVVGEIEADQTTDREVSSELSISSA